MSAICFNLDQSKILSSANGLTKVGMKSTKTYYLGCHILVSPILNLLKAVGNRWVSSVKSYQFRFLNMFKFSIGENIMK